MATGTVRLVAVVGGLTGYTGNVYGPGQQLDIFDTNQVNRLLSEGKAALVAPPARQVTVSAITTTTATVSFTVDGQSAVVRVQYGVASSGENTKDATPSGGTGPFTCNLTGLTTATTYKYAIKTWDYTGSGPVTTSDDYTFRTL